MKLDKYAISKIQDCMTTGFLALAIPSVFYFELWIILPDIYDTDSYQYITHFTVGIFLLINIIGNFIYTLLIKTDIKGEFLIAPQLEENETPTWHLCATCEIMVPPRTWHCKICKTCILKRDHHCSFTGKCIGHKNQRYFVLLVLYLFLATIYSSIFNNYYFWFIHYDTYYNAISLLKIVFPFAALMMQFVYDESQVYIIIYIIITLGMIFTGVLTVINIRLINRGAVLFEKHTRYNLGLVKNIRMVLGKRWYVAWIFPFIQSPLPHNGIHWDYLNRNL